ncbi:MAG: DUF4249 family protein [Bacteroidales bacterium]
MRKFNIIKIIVILTILSTPLSCNKSNEIVIDSYKPKLVIEGYLYNNRPISISVKGNLKPNEKAIDIPITDAKVIIWEDSLELGIMQHDSNGIYSINYHYYRVRVEHPDFPTSESVTYIKEPVQIDIISNKTIGYYSEVKIFLAKNDNIMRYYGFQAAIKLLSQYYCDNPIHDKYYYLFQSLSYIPGIDFISPGYYWRDGITRTNFDITNDPENGGEILFCNTKSLSTPYITFKIMLNPNVIIVNDLSEDVYQFFKSIVTYREQTESSLTSPFYNTSAIHNNVKNGLGIFGYIFSYEFPIDSIPSDCNAIY